MKAVRGIEPRSHLPSVIWKQTLWGRLCGVSIRSSMGVKGTTDTMLSLRGDLTTARALCLKQWKTIPYSVIYTFACAISFFTLKQLRWVNQGKENREIEKCNDVFKHSRPDGHRSDILREQSLTVWVGDPGLEGWNPDFNISELCGVV